MNFLSKKEIPFPPLNYRQMVGPLDDASYDNKSGDYIWGPLDFYPLRPGEAYNSIFDFGCGCGRNARQLMLQKRTIRKYVGIDASRLMIAWCQDNLSPIQSQYTFSHHDVYCTPYAPENTKNRYLPFPSPDNSFSLVNAHSVFTHLYADQSEFYLKEARRILRKNGIIRGTWFFFNKDFFPVMQDSQNCLYVNENDPTQAVYYNWNYFLNVLKTLELALISITWTQIPGFQNVVYLGRKDEFEDFAINIAPPKTIVGY
ncbi:MAG: class I SAM-dependent methyltransferase [bacterium]|nr:class I SAM-dependent methyltransferase [bacterium]